MVPHLALLQIKETMLSFDYLSHNIVFNRNKLAFQTSITFCTGQSVWTNKCTINFQLAMSVFSDGVLISVVTEYGERVVCAERVKTRPLYCHFVFLFAFWCSGFHCHLGRLSEFMYVMQSMHELVM